MNFVINPKFKKDERAILAIVANFSTLGKKFDQRERNQIRLIDLNGEIINVKSFKKPNFINKIIYRYFRKSKAKRSFEHANILLQNQIGTPEPIAFVEKFDFFGLTESYYLSRHLNYDLTFREISQDFSYPDSENILKQFTQFCYKLHQKGIEFLDHSPGNTLIEKTDEKQYKFYLVDLNRMRFHKKMNFKTRIKNLSHLTPKQEIVRFMSREYAIVSGESFEIIFEYLWHYTASFQKKFYQKKRLKKLFLFWRK